MVMVVSVCLRAMGARQRGGHCGVRDDQSRALQVGNQSNFIIRTHTTNFRLEDAWRDNDSSLRACQPSSPRFSPSAKLTEKSNIAQSLQYTNTCPRVQVDELTNTSTKETENHPELAYHCGAHAPPFRPPSSIPSLPFPSLPFPSSERREYYFLRVGGLHHIFFG